MVEHPWMINHSANSGRFGSNWSFLKGTTIVRCSHFAFVQRYGGQIREVLQNFGNKLHNSHIWGFRPRTQATFSAHPVFSDGTALLPARSSLVSTIHQKTTLLQQPICWWKKLEQQGLPKRLLL